MDARKIGLANSDLIRTGNYGVKDIDHGGSNEDSEKKKSWLKLPFKWNLTSISIAIAIGVALIVIIITCIACCRRRSAKRR